MEQRNVCIYICIHTHVYVWKKNQSEERKGRFVVSFLDRRIEKVRVVDRKSIGYGLLVGCCSADRLVRRTYSFGESSPPPWAPRRQARSASRNRVESRSQDTDTTTFPRQFRSTSQAPPHRWCTPARHSIALGSLHTLSRRAARNSRLYAHRIQRILVTTQGLSPFFPLSLFVLSRDQLFRPFFFPLATHVRDGASFEMREIVHLQAGQCGNQIGAKVSWSIDFS